MWAAWNARLLSATVVSSFKIPDLGARVIKDCSFVNDGSVLLLLYRW